MKEVGMEYFIGVSVALSILFFCSKVGFDRDRSFYPVITIIIATYYALFAIVGGSLQALSLECVVIAGFVLAAVLAFKLNLWWAAAALFAHGVFDFFHSRLIANPGVPEWWPGWCLAFDVTAAGYLAWRLKRSKKWGMFNTMDHSRQHILELKVPPVMLTAITATLMWIVAYITPFVTFTLPVRDLSVLVLMLTGVTISLLGVVSFRRAGTTVNPMNPGSSSVLVDSGIYGLTRNPMYLGFLFVLFGWSVYLSNLSAFLLLPAFILYMNRYQIEPEEKELGVIFGQPFVVYKARVRRWL